MRAFLLGGLMAAVVVGSAFAADMPLKAPPMVVAPTWNGTYVGINGGYASGTSRFSNNVGVTTGDFDIKGGMAGVTYGGNWQAGHVVLGFESDFDWAHINGTGGVGVTCGALGCTTNNKWLSTERMRAGWDFNGWLVYGTLGGAFARMHAAVGACVPGSCVDVTRAGWVGGVGVETMFWQNWSAKLEYLHYDLGDRVAGNFGAPITVLDRGDIIRAGINYHFNFLNLLHLN